jgi:hypothetical protein
VVSADETPDELRARLTAELHGTARSRVAQEDAIDAAFLSAEVLHPAAIDAWPAIEFALLARLTAAEADAVAAA